MLNDAWVPRNEQRVVPSGDLNIQMLHSERAHPRDGLTCPRGGNGLVVGALDHQEWNGLS